MQLKEVKALVYEIPFEVTWRQFSPSGKSRERGPVRTKSIKTSCFSGRLTHAGVLVVSFAVAMTPASPMAVASSRHSFVTPPGKAKSNFAIAAGAMASPVLGEEFFDWQSSGSWKVGGGKLITEGSRLVGGEIQLGGSVEINSGAAKVKLSNPHLNIRSRNVKIDIDGKSMNLGRFDAGSLCLHKKRGDSDIKFVFCAGGNYISLYSRAASELNSRLGVRSYENDPLEAGDGLFGFSPRLSFSVPVGDPIAKALLNTSGAKLKEKRVHARIPLGAKLDATSPYPSRGCVPRDYWTAEIGKGRDVEIRLRSEGMTTRAEPNAGRWRELRWLGRANRSM
ncbi:hypothetical protein SNOUR_42105 [Streptomyces noursei ATCC 11455]|nr:hypothetical protein SNOUR_42105 [Streptomyces noursei ATCC 11455]